MGQRLQLHSILKTLAPNVYFQEPASTVLHYPCIKYERTKIRSKSADNKPYNLKKEYTITVIDADPDSSIPDKIAELPQAIHDRAYKTNNLNHDVFKILF